MPSIPFKDEAEWLALRDMHVGGSDVASLFNQWLLPTGGTAMLHCYEAPPEGALHLECVSSYKSSFRLWQEKAGKLAPDFQETERVQAGKHLEPALAAWAQSKWPDWKLRKVRRYLRHDEVEGWGASLDYEHIAPGHPPVEFKNVDGLIFRDQWEGSGEDLVPPLHIQLQLQAQIGVGRADHGWIIACVGGNQLHRVKVPRHEPTIERLRDAIALFWAGVRADAEPTWLADADTVARLAVLNVPDKAPPADMTDDEAACRDARRYLRWKRHADFVSGQLDGMKARLGMRMLDTTRGLAGNVSITWPIVRREAKMIPAKFQTAAEWRGGFTVKERA